MSMCKVKEQARAYHIGDGQPVRWYVILLPSSHRGMATGLKEERERRIKHGESVFDYFAPSYVEVKKMKGKLVKTDRPLLYNYVFIRASVDEIFKLKQYLPQYNFLPKVKGEKEDYYPYLSDKAMENLKWIANSYSNVLPVYIPKAETLVKGDRIRITEGQFKGAEATVVVQPGAGEKDIMVSIENWMWVPLLHVKPGQYEVISLNEESKHVYSSLDNQRVISGLHNALQNLHHPDHIPETDKQFARKVIAQYGSLRMETDVMRCKLYSILLPAYALAGDLKAFEALVSTVEAILPAIKAEQSKALLLVMLYGCTDSSIYYEQAHQFTRSWRLDKNPKKSKLQLLKWLDDFDEWLGHEFF